MVKSISSLNSRVEGTSPTVLDLLVVAGVDAGRRFTLNSDAVLIRRGKGNERGVIQLHDSTVSRRQALIRSGPDGVVIEHDPSATNATRVNGKPIASRAISPGDSIQIGGVVIEVHEPLGMTLGGLLASRAPTEETGPRGAVDRSVEKLVSESAGESGGDTTETPAPEPSPFYLTAEFAGHEQRYPLKLGVNRVGRNETCDVAIPSDQRSVSRHQVDLVVSDTEVTLIHRSAKNTTALNGNPVAHEVQIELGDRLELGRAVLVLAKEAAGDTTNTNQSALEPEGQSLRQGMEQLYEQEERIQREYNVVGSFLDVDIEDSQSMKGGGSKPTQIVVSFERWRDWVRSIVKEFDGQVLNCNGDELMCFFETGSHARRALQAGGAILNRLDQFNEDRNIMPQPFRLRVGVHTGESLVDRQHGYAYSRVLDTAGHLQKAAETNCLLASEDTYRSLGEPDLMEPAGTLQPDGLKMYRLRVDRLPG